MQKPAAARRDVVAAYYAHDAHELQAALDRLELAVSAQAWSEGCAAGIAWGKAVDKRGIAGDGAQPDPEAPANPHVSASHTRATG